MTRKRTCVLLCLLLTAGLAVPAFAAEEALWSRVEPGGNDVTFRLPLEDIDKLDWQAQNRLYVRYADTKAPATRALPM